MLLAAFGITALLFAIPYAYDALRLAGATYLGWMAWNALCPGGRSPFEMRTHRRHGGKFPAAPAVLGQAAALAHGHRFRPTGRTTRYRFEPLTTGKEIGRPRLTYIVT